MKSMKSAEQTKNAAENTATSISPSTLGMVKFSLPSGEYAGVKIYAVSYLASRINEEGKELQATFGGLLETFTDPETGEVRGTRGQRDAVSLSFFGPSAERWAAALLKERVGEDGEILPARISDPKRDSVILGVREDAEDLSVIRTTDGRLKAVVGTTRTFSGKVKILIASPEVEFEVG